MASMPLAVHTPAGDTVTLDILQIPIPGSGSTRGAVIVDRWVVARAFTSWTAAAITAYAWPVNESRKTGTASSGEGARIKIEAPQISNLNLHYRTNSCKQSFRMNTGSSDVVKVPFDRVAALSGLSYGDPLYIARWMCLRIGAAQRPKERNQKDERITLASVWVPAGRTHIRWTYGPSQETKEERSFDWGGHKNTFR
ncbi:hypothetical protein BGW80DRAFT_1255272 [Lactifluus volemus]|nr:hypothetical protein BGW80DRAFT_1255272 [Lactifluus volemus]